MAAKFFVLLACVTLSSAAAPVVKRETDTPAVDWGQRALEVQKQFKDSLDKVTGSPDSLAFQKSLKDGTDSMLTQLGSMAQTLQAALVDANGKAKDSLEQIHANIEKTASELRQAHPEVEQQAAQLKDKLSAAIDNTLQGSQKLAKEFSSQVEEVNKKMEPQVRAAYEGFMNHVQELQKKISEAASKQ